MRLNHINMLSGMSVANDNVAHYGAVKALLWAQMGLNYITGTPYGEPWGQTIGDTSTRPANTACYLNRVVPQGRTKHLNLP